MICKLVERWILRSVLYNGFTAIQNIENGDYVLFDSINNVFRYLLWRFFQIIKGIFTIG